MTREEIENSMTLKDAIEVFKSTNAYGTMDIAKSVILKALEQEPCYVSKLTQKAYEDGEKDGYVQAKAEQEPVLDKIRAEILQLDYDLESVDYDHNDMAQTEDVHMICREEVLQIIDKYRGESEVEDV